MADKHRTARAQLLLTSCIGLTLGMAFAGPALARDWYVDGKYGDQSNPGSYAQPFLFFWQAHQKAQPGDNIYLQPTITYPTMWISANGADGAPITIFGIGVAPNLTKVSGFGLDTGISIGGDYITVTNLDVTAPGTNSAIHAPSGHHHMTITHNVLHDAGYNGIDLIGDDYVTISNNIVHNNASNTTQHAFASGISIKGSIDVDDNTGAKIQVNGNIVYANSNVPACYTSACWATATDSDGSGIILDNNRRVGIDNNPYRAFLVVSNNVVFGNGGRGIHLFETDHIRVDGNTVYSNNQDPYEGNYRPGEIQANTVSDTSILNNIVDSDGKQGIDGGKYTGTHVPLSVVYCAPGDGPIYLSNNLGFRPQNDPDSFLVTRSNSAELNLQGNLWGAPDFVSQTLNPSLANFRVRPGSLAIRHGSTAYAMYADQLGVRRTAPTTIGGYEDAVP